EGPRPAGTRALPGGRKVLQHHALGRPPRRIFTQRAPHDQAHLASLSERAIHVSQRAHRALEEHDSEAGEGDVVVLLGQGMNLSVAELVPHVLEARLSSLALGDVHERVGAVDAQHLSQRSDDAPDLQARLAETATDVEHAITGAYVEDAK